MQKVAIVVDKKLDSGRKVNCAVILMGQLALLDSGMYAQVFEDQTGVRHAAIRDNVVVLEGNENKMRELLAACGEAGIPCVAFTDYGQSLSYSFDQYRQGIVDGTGEFHIVGVGVYGEHGQVSAMTKKFSLLK